MDFSQELKRLGILYTTNIQEKFEKYYENLIQTNQTMNLTAITEREEVWRKHFLDSLEIVRVLPHTPNFLLCDVGSGAGFPSIPVAIVKEDISITIIDSLNKRISFLNQLIQNLELKNVEAYHCRAEDYAKEHREKFDVVTARAVAKLNVLVELCLPLTKVGGVFLAMKGTSGLKELEEAKRAIQILGGKVLDVIAFTLPDEQEQRQILVIKKVKSTSEIYPRNYNKIKEKPL